MKMRQLFLFTCLLFFFETALAQRDFFKNKNWTSADTLRGMLRQERTCFDVNFYDINLQIDTDKEYIKGYVGIHFKVVEDCMKIQIDLFENMKIDSITKDGELLQYFRLENAVFVKFPQQLIAKDSATIRVFYQGKPKKALRPPWEGGFVWKKDSNRLPWVGVACEGIGASLWWPCKDHLSDEPDSVSITVDVPSRLVAVCNGNLREFKHVDEKNDRFKWFVSYPINSYNVTLNIGNFQHFNDWYICEDGDSLALDYYVLPHKFERAKKYFKQVGPVLACYEKFFGKFPFPKDGYALVESPFAGMEHQGAIAYGNGFERGLNGKWAPETIDFDYILVHESAHEYFGNAVSVKDMADLWIHEGFATYMEALYVEYMSSNLDAQNYLNGLVSGIKNSEPIVGPFDVNYNYITNSDRYDKGAWILHTLRLSLADDVQFFGLLKGFYDKYKYKTCTSDDFVNFVNEYLKKDMTAIFEQYLHYPKLPTLEYDLEKLENGEYLIKCRWRADVEGFNLPVVAGTIDHAFLLKPTTKEVKSGVLTGMSAIKDFVVSNGLFYVEKRRL